MPKKKRTRAGTAKLSRPAMAVEKQLEDLDASMMSEGQPSKEEKIAILLQDFDIEATRRMKHVKAVMNKAITDQRNLLKMELLKIPKEIRKMKYVDFIKAGGDMDAVMLHGADALADNDILSAARNPLQELTSQNGMTSALRSTGSKRKPRATKTPMVKQTEGRVTRASKRAVASSQQTPAVDHIMQFKTPAPSELSNFAFKTPLITPKFDPRHPMTTGRRPKRGETLVSLAGSPVISMPAGNNNSIAVSIEEGQSPKFFGSILDLSPGSLANQGEQLMKLKSILDSKLQQIGKLVT